MASESSSAVLDTNDADVTDTEAPSVTDEAAESIPLIMEHGYDIAVKVDAPMKQLSTMETYVTYRVRCVCGRWQAPPHVRRRYNHFKVLHKRLAATHPFIAPPALPPLHSARQQLDRYSPAFVAIRTLALDAFLNRIAKHPIFTHSEDFRIFLTTPDEELDKIFKSENSALNLWGLSSALYGNTENKPTNGARVKDPEFIAAADYLLSLQQKLTTLCALTTKLHKGCSGVATELMSMKRTCDAWATQAALLPPLAATAAAHVDKIRHRDAVHAAYVAGNNTDELHNRLEQASEALRSELSDWIPKTRSEVKKLLLQLADRQVQVYTQTLQAWENALKLSTEADYGEIFKTVSRNAVHNLSPSKSGTPIFGTSTTEKDVEDLASSDTEKQDLSDIERDRDPLREFSDVDLSS